MTVADSTGSGLGAMGLFQYLNITALLHSDCIRFRKKQQLQKSHLQNRSSHVAHSVAMLTMLHGQLLY